MAMMIMTVTSDDDSPLVEVNLDIVVLLEKFFLQLRNGETQTHIMSLLVKGHWMSMFVITTIIIIKLNLSHYRP